MRLRKLVSIGSLGLALYSVVTAALMLHERLMWRFVQSLKFPGEEFEPWISQSSLLMSFPWVAATLLFSVFSWDPSRRWLKASLCVLAVAEATLVWWMGVTDPWPSLAPVANLLVALGDRAF
jgi:hypothetical protein